MPNKIDQVSRNAKWAITQTLVSALILFLLYKFLLSELGAAKLGLWSLILASTSLARLGELGFSNAALRFVGQYYGTGQKKDAADILETAIISISVPLLMICLATIPILGFLLPWFVPEQHIWEAERIVPWAMLALWMGITGGIIQSALDGCGRMDQRNMVLVLSNLAYLALSVYLAPSRGLVGVAIAQTWQAGLALTMTWILTKHQLPSLPICPWRWRKERFKEIAGFAMLMQTGSIIGMFIEPITKAFISRYSGLEFLGFYEMANQVVTRLRAVLISGFQAMLPQFALTREKERHQELFLASQRKVIELGVPFMTVVMMAFPVISWIWIGRPEASFILSGQILAFTWLLVTLMMPAYFFLAGTGRGQPIALGQAISLVGTAALGWAGGTMLDSALGQFGPMLGAALALIAGNAYFYRQALASLYNEDALPPDARQTVNAAVHITTAGFVIMLANYAANRLSNGLPQQAFILAAFACLIVFASYKFRSKTKV